MYIRVQAVSFQCEIGEVLDDIDVNQGYNTFATKFQELYDECIPLKINAPVKVKETLNYHG